MGTMKAVVTDPSAAGHLKLSEVDQPQPQSSEALVRVSAISLNRGEVRGVMAAQREYIPGWDLAGTVEEPAADGSGPKAGARVVGLMGSGAWAELAAVPTADLAELPDVVSFADAAALPVAGLTALHAVRKGGDLIERTVLVTGASGGVGLFAVELARLAGAHVVGLTRQSRHAKIVRKAGAHEVVAGEDAASAAQFGPYDLIVDGVGGAMLGSALDLLAPGGTCVSYGITAGLETPIHIGNFYRLGGATLYGLRMRYELRQEPGSVGLARLAGLVAKGRLHTWVEVEEPWTKIAQVAQRLMDRSFAGKAILYVREEKK